MEFTARPAWQLIAGVVGFVIVLCMISFLTESFELTRTFRRNDPDVSKCLAAVRHAESTPAGSPARVQAKAAAFGALRDLEKDLGASVMRNRYRVDTQKLASHIQSL